MRSSLQPAPSGPIPGSCSALARGRDHGVVERSICGRDRIVLPVGVGHAVQHGRSPTHCPRVGLSPTPLAILRLAYCSRTRTSTPSFESSKHCGASTAASWRGGCVRRARTASRRTTTSFSRLSRSPRSTGRGSRGSKSSSALAAIVDAATGDGGAGLGSTVCVVDEKGRKTEYELVGRRSHGSERREVTLASPVGQALWGARPGHVVRLRCRTAGVGRFGCSTCVTDNSPQERRG